MSEEFNPYDPCIWMGAGSQVRLLEEAPGGYGPVRMSKGACGKVIKADPVGPYGSRAREVRFDICCGLFVHLWIDTRQMELV